MTTGSPNKTNMHPNIYPNAPSASPSESQNVTHATHAVGHPVLSLAIACVESSRPYSTQKRFQWRNSIVWLQRFAARATHRGVG